MINENEFRRIYELYNQKLCYFLNYYTHDIQAIEEVVQDVFVKLWEERDNLNITFIKTYLYASTRNKMLNYLRNEQTRTILLERWAKMELEEKQAHDCIDRAEFFLLLQDAIDALPLKCREIFLLSRDGKKTYKEIADEKEISIKTVEAQMGIALKKIRERILHIYKGSDTVFLLLNILL
jgi:RNA polymerase sigma-70 factor (family 1)